MHKQYPTIKGLQRAIRIAYIGLISALVIGSVSPISAAQAAPAHEVITWYMDVANPKTKICVGETVEYSVTAYYVFSAEPRVEWPLPGVKIEARSSNTGVGTFKTDTVIAGFASEDLVTASFSFTAKKPGKTDLYFEAMVDKASTGTYISFTVPVTVIPCKFKVSTNSRWVYAGPYGSAFFFEFMKEANLTADEQGHFTGSSKVLWVAIQRIPNYGSVVSIHNGTVDLNGDVNEEGQLMLNVILNSVSGTETNCGAPGCGGGPIDLRPPPLKISFPATGGTRPMPHTLVGSGGSLPGRTTVTVIPMDGNK